MSRRRDVKAEGKCHYCLKNSATGWDHIVPRNRNGCDAHWNVVPSCAPCNSRKTDKMPTCICPRCLWAVWRWQRGDRAPTKAEKRELRAKRLANRKLTRLESEKYPSVVARTN